jgi:hypothetical protein
MPKERTAEALARRSWPTLGNDINQCEMCKHLQKVGHNVTLEGWKCAAFGDFDIPHVILRGRLDHRTPFRNPSGPSDNGILFEQAETNGGPSFEDMAGPVDLSYLD